MLDALYEFFYNIIFWTSGENASFDDFLGISFNINGYDVYLYDYLSSMFAIISMVIILVLCCLFVWKIIKLIGGLVTR